MGTSATAAKARYNRKTYDHITIRTRKGGNDAINELAAIRKRSKSDYIRELIRADAQRMGRSDLARAVGSGNPNAIAPPPTRKHWGTSEPLTTPEKLDRWIACHGAGGNNPTSRQEAYRKTFSAD
jgi:hypothetical protein